MNRISSVDAYLQSKFDSGLIDYFDWTPGPISPATTTIYVLWGYFQKILEPELQRLAAECGLQMIVGLSCFCADTGLWGPATVGSTSASPTERVLVVVEFKPT
jgi:hypothetical protein